MSSLFGSLNAARSALYAAQFALQTTSNNVANAATRGYSRQRVDLREAQPETLPVGQLGTGVAVDSIRRLRDQFMDQQYYQAQQVLGEYQAQQSTLNQIEALLGEPSDNGLQASLSRFFAAVHDLASYPSDGTTRRTVLEQARILAGDFNRLSNAVTGVKRNLESEIASQVAEVNDTLRQIAELNGQIQAVTIAGGSANSLMDRRDTLLDDLTARLGINRQMRSDGTVQVSMIGGGGMLVSGTTAATLGAQLSGTSDDYQLTLGGTVVTPVGGKLTGLLKSRNDPGDYVKYIQGQLDTLASTLIQQVNRVQATGAGLLGLSSTTSQYAVSDPAAALSTAVGLPFDPVSGTFRVFVYDASGAVSSSGTVTIAAGATSLNDLASALNGVAGLTASVSGGRLTVSATSPATFRFADDTSGALASLGLNAFFTGTDGRSIAVNPALEADPRLLSTGTPDPATGLVGGADNSAALRLAGLRETALLTGGTATLEDFYAASVGVVGARAAAVGRLAESQDLVVRTIENQRQQVSGVSLDEEMTELIRYQRAYEASARIIRMVDELLETVVNGLLR